MTTGFVEWQPCYLTIGGFGRESDEFTQPLSGIAYSARDPFLVTQDRHPKFLRARPYREPASLRRTRTCEYDAPALGFTERFPPFSDELAAHPRPFPFISVLSARMAIA
jgi:hypothetical protein